MTDGLDATPSVGEHVVVYQTSASCEDLEEVLARFPDIPFHVYGYRRELEAPVTEGNLTYHPFSEQGFVDHLASARAVVSNGGFSLMSEAVYLKKPFLAIPIASQFEQVMNGHYLEALGYGFTMDRLDEATLRHFLAHLESYREKVSTYEQAEGNGRLFALLDEHLDRVAAGLDPVLG